jgi:hypothetical protein
VPNHRDGPISAVNGLGECGARNHAKEAPGWAVTASQDENGCHRAEFITPTGARHLSKAPSLPGLVVVDVSELEVRMGVMIAAHTA